MNINKSILKKVAHVLILTITIFYSIPPSYSEGYYEFMDNIKGGLNKDNKEGIISAINTANNYKNRIDTLKISTDKASNYDKKTYYSFINRLIVIIKDESYDLEVQKKSATALTNIAIDDENVLNFFIDYIENSQNNDIREIMIQAINTNQTKAPPQELPAPAVQP